MSESDAFELGFVMVGAISAGAYTVGVIDSGETIMNWFYTPVKGWVSRMTVVQRPGVGSGRMCLPGSLCIGRGGLLGSELLLNNMINCRMVV